MVRLYHTVRCGGSFDSEGHTLRGAWNIMGTQDCTFPLVPQVLVFLLTWLGVCLFPLSAFASRPVWIRPSTSWGRGEVRYFRFLFPADSPSRKGWIKASADDEFEAFLNGHPLGCGKAWEVAVTFDVSTRIREGLNVLAFRVVNRKDTGGLIAEGEFVLSSGETARIATDSSWKVQHQLEDGWTLLDFDDQGWTFVETGYSDQRFGPSLSEKEELMRAELERNPVSLPRTSPRPELFVGETFRSQNAVWQDVEQLRRVCDILRDMRFNLISIDIPWGKVEREPGQYDFSAFDLRIHELLRHGFCLQIKVNFLGSEGGQRHPVWLDRKESLYKRSSSGKRDQNATLTYASEELNQRMAKFCAAVAKHYRDYPVINYSLLSSVSGEVEYHHAEYQDYSEPAQDQFRRWVTTRYGTVDALNKTWGTNLSSFDEVALPVPQDPVPDDKFDFDPTIVDFFRYREFCLDTYFVTLAQGFREGDPNAQVALTVGHVLSQECARRNTLSAFRWLRHADWFWVDPAPTDFYPIRIAVGRACQLLGKRLAVELDGLYAYRRDHADVFEAFPRQTRLSFEGRAEMVTTANWQFAAYGPSFDPPEFDRFGEAHRGMAAFLSPGKVQVPDTATDAVYISKWTMFATHGNGKAWKKIEEYYKSLYGDGDRLVDVITDDVFTASPAVLARYKRIHVPYAPVVEKIAWDALRSSGVELVALDPWGSFDELGNQR